MFLLSGKKSDTAHWSVDFVEHLRAVHFGMVTVAAALIILVSGSRDTRVSKALTQATQIVEFQSRWAEVQKTVYSSAAQSLNFPIEESTYFIRVAANTEALPGHQARLRMTLTSDFITAFKPWKFSGAAMKDSPRNLAEFRIWWDRLHTGTTVTVPNVSGGKGGTCTLDVWEQDEAGKIEAIDIDIQGKTHLVAPGVSKPAPPNTCKEGAGPEDLTSQSYLIEEIDLDPIGKDGSGFTLTGWARKLKSGKASKTKLTTGLSVQFIIGGNSVTVNESILQGLFSDWRTGKYSEAFSELADATKDYETIALKSIPARLQDLQPKGEQNIEAFGLRVPSSDITRWGLVLLLAVQFYFWLHLHELNRKIDKTAPGWDVAWIGIYHSLSASISMIISACLLPTIAVLVLGLRIPSDIRLPDHRWIPWTVAVMAVLASSGLGFATAERLYHLRAYRKEQSASATP